MRWLFFPQCVPRQYCHPAAHVTVCSRFGSHPASSAFPSSSSFPPPAPGTPVTWRRLAAGSVPPPAASPSFSFPFSPGGTASDHARPSYAYSSPFYSVSVPPAASAHLTVSDLPLHELLVLVPHLLLVFVVPDEELLPCPIIPEGRHAAPQLFPEGRAHAVLRLVFFIILFELYEGILGVLAQRLLLLLPVFWIEDLQLPLGGVPFPPFLSLTPLFASLYLGHLGVN